MQKNVRRTEGGESAASIRRALDLILSAVSAIVKEVKTEVDARVAGNISPGVAMKEMERWGCRPLGMWLCFAGLSNTPRFE